MNSWLNNGINFTYKMHIIYERQSEYDTKIQIILATKCFTFFLSKQNRIEHNLHTTVHEVRNPVLKISFVYCMNNLLKIIQISNLDPTLKVSKSSCSRRQIEISIFIVSYFILLYFKFSCFNQYFQGFLRINQETTDESNVMQMLGNCHCLLYLCEKATCMQKRCKETKTRNMSRKFQS